MSKDGGTLHYSEPSIAYDNLAIVRKRDKIAIRDIGDLPGYNVVAWQNAHDHRDLPGSFGPSLKRESDLVVSGSEVMAGA